MQNRLRVDPRTQDYYERRSINGKTRRDIVRGLIGKVSMLRPNPWAVTPWRVSGDGLVAVPRSTASLSIAAPDTPMHQTGVKDMPHRGPNNEEPTAGSRHLRNRPPTPDRH
ncbi:hypothetical protein GCM10010339_90600 [Streptomyces alanosinicus]|uniref:Uncharacterized protein n=1 Tax=Streptomyces alanosinicus TaxID=68171 RepID=A0A919D8L6_9ACTN|nr:hypothetical protein GCM10010339_90600 [Streptomyces alanosinicus]